LIVDGQGAELWRKTIPVMLVYQAPRWPKFGASYTKLRYDSPISIRDPKTGTFSSMSYEQGWNPALQDVVVSLPSGARFVFWRGSSYIPFWAAQHNTGACYEWAEIISRMPGAVDCVEPLMDKELRYGRVEIVESTAARVHVRWTYQSTDLNYKVWGDQPTEDYFFYPDGFGARVLTLNANPSTLYELSEFIILTPQGTYPLDVLANQTIEMIALNGSKATLRLPLQADKKDADPRKAIAPPALYRFLPNRQERMSAIYFNPRERQFPPLVFPPFFDRGQLVTPYYWGSHWPLARGNATGSAIDDRVALTPCHNSLMSWVSASPGSVWSRDVVSQGEARRISQWAWLIGMSDEPDETLLQRARSWARPASLEISGAERQADSSGTDPIAIPIRVKNAVVAITLKPSPIAVNPVFELVGAPQGPLTLSRDGRRIGADSYAWDGKTLWLNATITSPTELRLEFAAPTP
jgi:hypothetical protein